MQVKSIMIQNVVLNYISDFLEKMNGELLSIHDIISAQMIVQSILGLIDK